MVFCGLCKKAKEPKQNWFIQEHGADSPVNKFKICDECAALLMRGMAKKVMGVREGQMLPSPLIISRTGVIDEIILNNENALDITIAIDIGKARRWVEKEIEDSE